MIVGFPGETEDFEASMGLCIGMEVPSIVHVFPHSRREGMAAYDFPGWRQEHEKGIPQLPYDRCQKKRGVV